eukprot:12884915-Prorocentrum_lima.AAC.1
MVADPATIKFMAERVVNQCWHAGLISDASPSWWESRVKSLHEDAISLLAQPSPSMQEDHLQQC